MRSKRKIASGKSGIGEQPETLLVFTQAPNGWIVVRTHALLKDLKFPVRKRDLEKQIRSKRWFVEYRPRPTKLFDMTLSTPVEPMRIPFKRLLEMAPVTVFDDEKEFVNTMQKTIGALSSSDRATEIRQSWSGKLADLAHDHR